METMMKRLQVVALVCVFLLMVGSTALATKKRRVITIRPDPTDPAKCRIDYEKVNISHDPASYQRIVWKGKQGKYIVLFKKSATAKFDTPCYVNSARQFSFEVPKGAESDECFVPESVHEKDIFGYSIYKNNETSACLDPAVIVTDGGRGLDSTVSAMPKQSTSSEANQAKPLTDVTADLVVDINDNCIADNPAVNLYKTDSDADTLQWTTD